MAKSHDVVEAYVELRDALTSLAQQVADTTRRQILRQRSLVAGALAEQCSEKFGGGDVPGGGAAISEAQAATVLAKRPNQTNEQVDETIAAATKANATLHQILSASPAVSARAGLRGALRVSPSRVRSSAPATGARESSSLATKVEETSPAYVASVALLFPVEATTLFPMARSIASSEELKAGTHGNAYVLVGLTAVILVLIVVFRYFATQDKDTGEPSPREIGIAIVSFLLWIGATSGYWIPYGGFASAIPVKLGTQIFAFITIIWVAIVPYFVREPSLAVKIRQQRVDE